MTFAAIWKLIGIRGAIAIGVTLTSLAIIGVLIIQRDAARDRAEDIQQAYFQQQAEYKAAQAEAALKAKAAREAIEQERREDTERRDEQLVKLESQNQRLADRYIAANRVSGKACGASGRTGTAGEDIPTEGPDGAYSDAELVAVPTTDVKICTTLHTRLTAAQEWARSLTENN